ncbi:MAG: hypothetical protein DWQ20_06025 [Actinobacteria bacterium]|nr:MAG: hypothetical protein DWQ20_06025 [Actinomycetota bacterium]
MRNRYWAALVGCLLFLVAVPATGQSGISTGIDDILNDHENRILTLEAQAHEHSTTTTTTSTLPPDTTTTTSPPPSNEIRGWCIDVQVNRGGFGRFDDRPEFEIDLNSATFLDPGGGGRDAQMWVAPYAFDTDGDRHGWISGDRAGYSGAYMFLYAIDDGVAVGDLDGNDAKLVGRVTFQRAVGYGQTFDQYMAEIQETSLRFDGVCDTAARQSNWPNPIATVPYVETTDPDFRPLICFTEVATGECVEDRSYTNTVPEDPGVTFGEFERITEPFMQAGSTPADGSPGSEPHVVYERVTVLGYLDGVPVHAVYYDVLDPAYSLVG